MKGHTLPGINQRSEGKNLSDGRAKSSAFQKDVKIGPAESPEAIKKKRQAYNEVPLGKEYDAEYDKKRAEYKDAKKYPGATEYKKEGAPMKGLLPEVEVADKKDKITLATPTKEELAKAKRRGGETSGGLTASMKVNETTGKSKMVTVVSNKEKADALQAAQDKVFAYNKANKGKPGYKRQTFAKNISKDNKYIN